MDDIINFDAVYEVPIITHFISNNQLYLAWYIQGNKQSLGEDYDERK